LASVFEGGPIDCSIGTPVDAPPEFVVEELARGAGARGYPPSAGSLPYRTAAAEWMNRRFGLEVAPDDVAACVGTKEFRRESRGLPSPAQPERDTVLYPAISYPTYAMGATLAGLRSVPVEMVDGQLDLSSIAPSDVERALVIWGELAIEPDGTPRRP